MPLQVYRLGVTFAEIAGAGQDEMLQMGSEESFAALTTSRATDRQLHLSKFESISSKTLTDAQSELER